MNRLQYTAREFRSLAYHLGDVHATVFVERDVYRCTITLRDMEYDDVCRYAVAVEQSKPAGMAVNIKHRDCHHIEVFREYGEWHSIVLGNGIYVDGEEIDCSPYRGMSASEVTAMVKVREIQPPQKPQQATEETIEESEGETMSGESSHSPALSASRTKHKSALQKVTEAYVRGDIWELEFERQVDILLRGEAS